MYKMQDIQVGNKVTFLFNKRKVTGIVKEKFNVSLEVEKCSEPIFDNSLIDINSVTYATAGEKQISTTQELDKDCLDQNIEQLIVLTNESKQIERKIEYVKKSIQEYANENGVIYSDSSHAVSLVYTPNVEWDDEQIENCDMHISDFEEQIKAIKEKQDAFKEMRKARISELQSEIKANCIKENAGINQIHSEFACIKSFKDSFQVRIAKSKISQKTQKHESEFERSWIYKKLT